MITVSLNGAVTDFINGTSMVENPSCPDEKAFADHWGNRTERTYGRGYRATLTAPAWVFNWIADFVEPLLKSGMEATPQERNGARELRTTLTREGVRKADYDGPTALELEAAGYLPTP
jgi:hypothetical protein